MWAEHPGLMHVDPRDRESLPAALNATLLEVWTLGVSMGSQNAALSAIVENAINIIRRCFFGNHIPVLLPGISSLLV